MMKRICSLLLLSLPLSCAGVSTHYLDLAYKPQFGSEAAKKGSVTVALLRDKRLVAETWVVGLKDKKASLALKDDPPAVVAQAFRAYFESRGYSVNRVDEAWDGSVESLKPQWRGMVVGGDIENLDINVTSTLATTEYVCVVKLNVIMADPKTKTILHQERVETTSSYVSVFFSRDKAQEILNAALASAMEKSLVETATYFPER